MIQFNCVDACERSYSDTRTYQFRNLNIKVYEDPHAAKLLTHHITDVDIHWSLDSKDRKFTYELRGNFCCDRESDRTKLQELSVVKYLTKLVDDKPLRQAIQAEMVRIGGPGTGRLVMGKKQ